MLESKISRLPMGDDIATLLLLCAPPNALKELDLSDENEGKFADHFNSLNDYFKYQMIALALYYANRNTVNFIKSNSIVRLLYISPEVVHSLVQLADTESFSETEGMINEIWRDHINRLQQRPSLINKEQSKEQWEPYIAEFDKLLEQGKSLSWARNKISDMIEAENIERSKRGDEFICVTKSNDGTRKLRPSDRNRNRQLRPKEK